MMGAQWRRPGRAWPQVAGWATRAWSASAVQGLVVAVGALTWDRWLMDTAWLPGQRLGWFAGGLAGYVCTTFVFYWWHRARHEVPWLWRWVHQAHHSPQRLEVITSFYKHPLEMVLNSLLMGAVHCCVLGLTPAAVSFSVLLCGVAELFYHWNVETPRWLGRWIQRPEMHCEHHRAGAHRNNYADLPLWDMLFGTYHNPEAFDGRCGFGADEHRVGDMLRGRRVA